MEGQNTHDSPHNSEGQEQIWRTDTIQLQELL